jgi:hypothetical protein
MTASKPASHRAWNYAWWLVLCVVGLDYFSTLAYLPSIAVEAAASAGGAALAPLVVVGVVLVTLLAAVPVYLYVVGRSPHGNGATGLLENLVQGWIGKLLILVLLGFIGTDFVITRTLSVADASAHILSNPALQWWEQHHEGVRAAAPTWLQADILWNKQIVMTVLLSVIGFVFWAALRRGFTPWLLKLTVGVVVAYLFLTAFVVASGLIYLSLNPQMFNHWWTETAPAQLHAPSSNVTDLLWPLLLMVIVTFPQMALGLSGFELSMTSAPLVRGDAGDDPALPRGRIRNTRWMLFCAAVVMSVFILASVLVVSLLVPESELREQGAASHRALAYLAHGGDLEGGLSAATVNPLFGPWFGTLYDASTVLILFLAGASATVSLRDVVPHYLARFGMQLEWASQLNVILQMFNVIILIVTLVFKASVSSQQWAYAASVLVLLTSASLAAILDVRQRWRGSWLYPFAIAPFCLIFGFFLTMAGMTIYLNRSGLTIALGFVICVLITAIFSRWLRSKELRFQGFDFADGFTSERWDALRQVEFQVLVPHRPGLTTLADKEEITRKRHRLTSDVMIVFIEATLGDPSEFTHKPLMKIEKDDGREVIRVSKCVSIAHVLAAVCLEFTKVGRPPEIHFGWSNENPMAANFRFLFLGEGNIPWMVHELLVQAERNPTRQPRVVIG